MPVRLLIRHDRAMGTPHAFGAAENWAGGSYDLAIEVGPRSDARLQRVLTAVWSAAGVQGCSVTGPVSPVIWSPWSARWSR